MTANPLKGLLSEKDRLESELRGLIQYRQLEAVRGALKQITRAYGIDLENRKVRERRCSRAKKPKGAPGRERPGSMASVIAQVALDRLKATGRRATSSEILKLLEAKGHRVSGKKPTSTIACALAQKSWFDNAKDDRGVGYGLVAWTSDNVRLD